MNIDNFQKAKELKDKIDRHSNKKIKRIRKRV